MRLQVCLIVGVLAAMSGSASAISEAHDFSGSGWSQGEVCLPCHTPHNSISTEYLWNHAMPADADFTKREGSTLGTHSLMCLGCHDGQTAIDSIGGQPGQTVMTGDSVIGRDLTDDHPVGVEYTDGHGRRAPIGTMWGTQPGVDGKLPLYGENRIECTTCHTPHDNSNNNFLRISNAGSAMCLTCHLAQGN